MATKRHQDLLTIFERHNIARGYFSVIALNFTDTPALDHRIAAQLHHDPRYRITQVVPYGIEVKPYGLGTCVIWQYQPPR